MSKTRSGIEIQPLYGPDDVKQVPPPPGEYPFTRGIHRNMYLGKLWTMRQYAGFGTPRETNQRFKYLLGQGQTGLSLALDLPTQLGLDADDPEAEGEVGKVGVSIGSLADMDTLLDGSCVRRRDDGRASRQSSSRRPAAGCLRSCSPA